ncbi:MAG: hypothetical protein ACRBN8_27030 [Nannocystales bacterium]
MSEPLVAGVVCEGHTDFPVLRAIVESLWPEIDDVLCLQPQLDATQKASNPAGWSEVRRWCEDHAGELDDVIESDIGDPLCVLIIAIDVDIAVQAKIANPPQDVGAYETTRLKNKIRSWCRTAQRKKIPPRVVLSTPVMAIENWVIAALFPRERRVESVEDPAGFLVNKDRLRLSPSDGKPWKELHRYQAFGQQVGAKLSKVRKACSEAEATCSAIEQLRDL